VAKWEWFLASIAITLAFYALFIVVLALLGRRKSVRAVAGFVPDVAVLFTRLLRDGRVPRRTKVLVALVVPYLLSPIDLVPDFIPVAGYLDDAVVVALVLRRVVRGAGADLVQKHWPGPESSLDLVLRLGGASREA
jgi:uncharacterized membrane protein YkvA (DUF1232 family)